MCELVSVMMHALHRDISDVMDIDVASTKRCHSVLAFSSTCIYMYIQCLTLNIGRVKRQGKTRPIYVRALHDTVETYWYVLYYIVIWLLTACTGSLLEGYVQESLDAQQQEHLHTRGLAKAGNYRLAARTWQRHSE